MTGSLDIVLNQLIIIAGQWRDKIADHAELEQQFGQALNELEERTGKSRDQVILILLQYLEGVVP